MTKTLTTLLNAIPTEWIKIKKHEYEEKQVRGGEGFEIIEAFDVDDELVILNHYPEIPEFIDAYNEQMQEIKNKLQGENWREISTINPIKFKFLKTKAPRVFLSVFEARHINTKVSVQVFIETKAGVIGFLTSVRKVDGQGVINTVNKHKTVKNICELANTLD